MKIILNLLLVGVIFFFISGCKKKWLDAKPELSLTVPSTIKDYQALLDGGTTSTLNSVGFSINQISLGEIGAGDFYSLTARWQANPINREKNAYIWAPDIFSGGAGTEPDWYYPYKKIFYANLVLDGIDKIVPVTSTEIEDWGNVKGSAYFFRAYNHYDIAQHFCKWYDKSSANSDLGIPLRLTADFNDKSFRTTVEETYGKVIDDLKNAAGLLPVSVPSSKTYKIRPTKAAAFSMLARVYLTIEEYDSAFLYSDKALSLYSTLIDYNTLSSTSSTPIARFNDEVIWHCTMSNAAMLLSSFSIVDSSLYKLYLPGDRRSKIFFGTSAGNVIFKGSYNQSQIKFTGLATDELYVIRAECNARKGNTSSALIDINTLLMKRWDSAFPFEAITAINPEEALSKIIVERRKELCFRGLRWTDLRRLNKDDRFKVVLKRVIDGQTYELKPNDKKYVLPIPNDIIQLSGMQQNPRE